jgi:GYD domain
VAGLSPKLGGKLVAYYLTSGEYDILLIFEGPSYEDTVPALIVAAAGNGLTALNTVTALTSNEMKEAFVKAGKIAASYRSREARTAGLSATQPETDQPISASPHEGKASGEAQEDKVAATILDAEKKAVDDIPQPITSPHLSWRMMLRNPLFPPTRARALMLQKNKGFRCQYHYDTFQAASPLSHSMQVFLP